MSASRFIASRLASSGDGSDRQSRISNIIACVSVCLSFVVMIVAVAVLGGFKSEIRSKATGFIGSVQLVAPGTSPMNELSPIPSDLSYIESIRDLDNVTSVDAVAYRSGIIQNGETIDGVFFKGVDSLYNLSFFESTLSEGQLPDYHGRISSDVILSSTTAKRMGLSADDEFVAYFIGDKVNVRKFRIAGVFDAQLENVDAIAVADIRQVQRLNGWDPDEVSSVEIGLEPGADIERARYSIEEIEFLEGTEDDMPLFVTSVKKVYGYLFDWLALLDMNVAMILVLMIIVAAFNMISAVLIILFEKISMIGLLKSMGMTDKSVWRVFFLRSSKIVGKGMIIGNFIGITLCLVQKWFRVITLDPASYFVKYVPIELKLGQIVLLDIIAAALIMALVSISSLFISRISPDKTMKME